MPHKHLTTVVIIDAITINTIYKRSVNPNTALG